jgi:predicted nucleotidyltransferase
MVEQRRRVPHLTPAERAAVDEFLDEVRRRLGPDLHEVRLFGSRARGEGTDESDLDLAVIVTPQGRARRYEVYDAAFDIGLRHGVRLAPFVVSEKLRARERRVAAELDQEGILL